jgi:hypothetical protein
MLCGEVTRSQRKALLITQKRSHEMSHFIVLVEYGNMLCSIVRIWHYGLYLDQVNLTLEQCLETVRDRSSWCENTALVHTVVDQPCKSNVLENVETSLLILPTLNAHGLIDNSNVICLPFLDISIGLQLFFHVQLQWLSLIDSTSEILSHYIALHNMTLTSDSVYSTS